MRAGRTDRQRAGFFGLGAMLLASGCLGESPDLGGDPKEFGEGSTAFTSFSELPSGTSAGTGLAATGADADPTAQGGGGTGAGSPEPALLTAPLIFAPTPHGFGLNAVVHEADPSLLRAEIRPAGAVAWSEPAAPSVPADDVAQWRFEGLEPGSRYEYRVSGVGSPYEGSTLTQRAADDTDFSFALITDSHIAPRDFLPGDATFVDTMESTLISIAEDIADDQPDFVVNLGDMLDFHLFGFNAPPPDGSWTRLAYLNYRRLLGDLLGQAPHFGVIGNWDGENGCFSDPEVAFSRAQRLLYAPGPRPETYPQGGSPAEDYYAFTWGDALFIVLNVMTYTETCHLLNNEGGTVEDWTLGDEQMLWFEDVLANATARWRFVLIHHAVGGAGGTEANARYGRGGGLAADVGEQALVHTLMRQYGVQVFFYGHDHVFTDMVVDDIHYTLPGSAGAPWKFGTTETGYAQYWPDSGWSRVEVSADAVRVEFISITGERLYEYTLE